MDFSFGIHFLAHPALKHACLSGLRPQLPTVPSLARTATPHGRSRLYHFRTVSHSSRTLASCRTSRRCYSGTAASSLTSSFSVASSCAENPYRRLVTLSIPTDSIEVLWPRCISTTGTETNSWTTWEYGSMTLTF